MTMKKVICCGNISFDLIATSRKNEENMVFHARPGGSVFNTAIQLSRLGISVSMLTKTGNDFLSNTLLNIMRGEKISTKYAVRDEKIKAGLAFARIDKKGNSSYTFYKSEGKQISFNKEQLSPSIFNNAAVFHTGSVFTYSDFSFENALDLMRKARKKGVFVTYDPNWRGTRIKNKPKARRRIRKLLQYVDLLKLSANDARGITGRKTLSGALKVLPVNIIVTLGEKGSFFWNGKKKIYQPAFKVKVVDTIGAGDAFTAGLISRYAEMGRKIIEEKQKETLKFATAVSAIVCQAQGATAGLKSLRQVHRSVRTRAGR